MLNPPRERAGPVRAGEAAERSEGSLDRSEHSRMMTMAGEGAPRDEGPCPPSLRHSRPVTRWSPPSAPHHSRTSGVRNPGSLESNIFGRRPYSVPPEFPSKTPSCPARAEQCGERAGAGGGRAAERREGSLGRAEHPPMFEAAGDLVEVRVVLDPIQRVARPLGPLSTPLLRGWGRAAPRWDIGEQPKRVEAQAMPLAAGGERTWTGGWTQTSRTVWSRWCASYCDDFGPTLAREKPGRGARGRLEWASTLRSPRRMVSSSRGGKAMAGAAEQAEKIGFAPTSATRQAGERAPGQMPPVPLGL
jgi:hypothetical protein